jgi:hypothetical protein
MIMNRLVVGLALSVLGGVACGGSAYPDASSSTVTSANIATSNVGDSVADRIARMVCIHEVECGRVHEPELCVDASRSRVASELGAWTCDPESARVSAEQCLATLKREACSVDLSARENVCSPNGGCARAESTAPAAASR